LELDGRRTEIRHDLPEIGEHGREILEELGFSKLQIDDMAASGALLDK
jgi:crotonobetainyl-CoA:carnitine CoA-transferase CaiB-like acyl-CoA transferase